MTKRAVCQTAENTDSATFPNLQYCLAFSPSAPQAKKKAETKLLLHAFPQWKACRSFLVSPELRPLEPVTSYCPPHTGSLSHSHHGPSALINLSCQDPDRFGKQKLALWLRRNISSSSSSFIDADWENWHHIQTHSTQNHNLKKHPPQLLWHK